VEAGPSYELVEPFPSTSRMPTFYFLLYAPDPAAGPIFLPVSIILPESSLLNYEILLDLSVYEK